MYHQLIPELLEGTMIIIKNNHLSDDLMVDISLNSIIISIFSLLVFLQQQISLLAALQYRASKQDWFALDVNNVCL